MAEEEQINLEERFTIRRQSKALGKLGLVEDNGVLIPHPKFGGVTEPQITKGPQGTKVEADIVGSNKPLEQIDGDVVAGEKGQLLTKEFPEASLGLHNVRQLIKDRTGATEESHDLESFVQSGEPFVFDKNRGHLIVPEKYRLTDLPEPGEFIEKAGEISEERQKTRQRLSEITEPIEEAPETIENFIGDVNTLRQNEEATRQKLLELKSRVVEPVEEPETVPTTSQKLGELVLDVTTGIPRKIAAKVSEFVIEAGDDFRNIELDTNVPGGGTTTVQEILDAFGLGGKIKVPKPEELQFKEGQEGRKFVVDMGAFIAMMAILKQAGAGTLPASFGSEFLTVDANQNLSNMFNQLAPELRNPITDFLEAKIDDSELEKRLKMLAESGALGVTLDLALAFARRLKSGGFQTLRNEDGTIQFGPGDPKKTGIKGKKVFSEKEFVDSGGITRAPKKQIFSFRKREFDLGRFSINWDRINKPNDVKGLIREFRKKFKKQLLEALPDKRGLDEVALEALDRLQKSTDDEFSQFLIRDFKEGFTDVDLAVAKWFRGESAAELLFLKEQAKAGVPGMRQRFMEHRLMHFEIERIHQAMQAISANLLNANKVVLDLELGTGKDLFADQVDEVIKRDPGGFMSADVDEAILQLDNLSDPIQLETYAKNLGRPGFNEMLEEAYVAGLLSSPKTHAVNWVSNTLTLLNHFGPERMFRAGVGSVTRSSDRVRFGELKESLFGFSEAMREAWKLSKQTFRTGEPTAPGIKFEGRIDQAISAQNVDAMLKRIHNSKNPARFFLGESLDESGVVGRAFDAMGMMFSVPFRGLMAADDFFKTMAYRLEVNALAYRKSVNKGLTGKELAEEIARLKTEVPQGIQLEAAAASRYITFTESLGRKGQSIQDAIKTIGMPARFVVPFIRTPTNIFKYNLERTPGLNLFLAESRQALLKGGEARDTALARLMMGGMIAYSVMELTDRGMVTGSAADFEALTGRALRNTDFRAGWRRNSILLFPPELLKEHGMDFDPFYISYDRGGDAFGMLMGLASDYRKLSMTAPDDVTEKAFAVITASLRNQILNRTWMANFRQFMEIINYTDEPEDMSRLARTVVPRLIANLRTEVDPAMREARTVIDQLKNEVPFYSEDLSLRLNVWGDWIPADGSLGWDFISPFTVSPKSKDEVDLEMQRQRIALTEVPRVFEMDGARIELTPEQMNRWKIIAGKELKQNGRNLKESIRHLINTPRYKEATDGPGGGKELLVQSVYRAFKDSAKVELLKEDDVLRAEWRKEVKKMQERLQGAGQ